MALSWLSLLPIFACLSEVILIIPGLIFTLQDNSNKPTCRTLVIY